MPNDRGTTARLIIGSFLIIIGGLFLLDNFGYFELDLPYEIGRYLFRWQTILIIIGIITYLASHSKATGSVLIVIGLIGFFPEFWPLLLVLIGLYIIYKKNKSETEDSNKTDDTLIFDDLAVFGGHKKNIDSSNFVGGKSTSIFGGSELDLRNCKLAEGRQVIDVLSIFGGSTFFVPSDWNVEIDVFAIFGGFSDKRRKDPNIPVDDKTKLVFKGLVIFGGGEVKN